MRAAAGLFKLRSSHVAHTKLLEREISGKAVETSKCF